MLAYKAVDNLFYYQLVLKNGTSLIFNVEHNWATSNPNKWYQSYGCSPNDVVGIGGAIHSNSQYNEIDP